MYLSEHFPGSALVINFVLLDIYGERLEIDESLDYWLRQGYNSISIGFNILVTVLGMWIGSSIFSISEDETERVNHFFTYMSVPTEPKIEKTKDKKQSPFYVVSIAVMLLGIIIMTMGLIMKFSGDTRAFTLDSIAGGTMFFIGLLIFVKSSILK